MRAVHFLFTFIGAIPKRIGMNTPNRRWTALGGFLLDLWHVAQGKPINPHSLQKFQIINAARKKTGATQFIEVGTYKGVTTHRCARVFDRVWSIELSPELHQASQKFLAARKNVELCLGDGAHWLKVLLERSELTNVVIFLDGHFSGEETALGDEAEPALNEIALLSKFKHKVAGIIIDDFRTFGSTGVPPKSALLKAIEQRFPEYQLSVHLDQCIVTRETVGVPLRKAA